MNSSYELTGINQFLNILKKCRTVILVSLLATLSTSSVSAISPEELQTINLGMPIYYGGDITDDGRANCADDGSLDNFLKALALKESGGNPNAYNEGSGAAGKYQYLESSWNGFVTDIYPPAEQYAEARDAPEEVQDAVAYLDHLGTFRAYDGDLMAMAIHHFGGGAIAEDPSQWDNPAPGHNTETYREFAEDMLEGMESGEGQDIELYYHQAPDFETHLEEAGGLPEGLEGGRGGCIVDGGLVETALGYAWPDNVGSSRNEQTPAYEEAHQQALQDGEFPGGCGGNDCGAFVTRVMRNSGFDPDYNSGEGNTSTQRQYLDQSDNWTNIGEGGNISTAELQPGDVAIWTAADHSGQFGHTFIYVGDQPDFETQVASAAVSGACSSDPVNPTGGRAPEAGGESLTDSRITWFRYGN